MNRNENEKQRLLLMKKWSDSKWVGDLLNE